MKKILTLCLLAAVVAIATPVSAQAVKLNAPSKSEKGAKQIYDPHRDAMKDLNKAIDKASESGRYVLCQVGGNWCPWCLKFVDFVEKDDKVKQMIDENFVYLHINYSPENKNPEVMKLLGNPARFGFPVFVILNQKGDVLHIQNSSYLEEDKSYNSKKVMEFLGNWTEKAVTNLR